MPIFEVMDHEIRPIPVTTFAEEQLKEREDLQRLLQNSIQHIAPDTMVLTEEFGSWDEGSRRIDLLGLDKECRLVVIELKRTEDGGHMELQAIRYAAMVSSMTFDQAVDAHRKYLDKKGQADVDAQANILKFLGVQDRPELQQKVRLVLAAADFSKEITTTVLWLNASGLDVRCVRMRPHRYAPAKVLLDIQQVIPLPEAAEYQIAIQQKSAAVQAATGKMVKDFTKYDLLIGDKSYERLSKRDLMFYVVQEAIRRGHTPDQVHKAMPWDTNSLLIGAAGELDAETYITALRAMDRDPRRYFCSDDRLFRIGDTTYALNNQWGASTEASAQAVIDLIGAPETINFRIHIDE